MEEWRSIVGYEGLYEVSSLGRIRSLDRWKKNRGGRFIQKGAIKNPYPQADGYLQVGLSKNGKRSHLVHRLVGFAFLGLTQDQEINHKDFNRTNNAVTNLECVSRIENVEYSHQRGRYNFKSERGLTKLTADQVLEIRMRRKIGQRIIDISQCFSVSVNAVSCIVNRRAWGHLS